jgi:rod shape-determining protein MreD
MVINFFHHFLRFIVAAGLQVFVLNNLEISGLINPFFYVVFLLLLPFDTSKGLLIFLAFLLGITIDIFSQTLGIHAGASVLLAFLRPYVLEFLLPRENMEPNTSPSLHVLGFPDFIKYVLILVLFHHLFLFFIEVFRFSDSIFTLLRTFISTVFSSLLIVISQLIIFKK